MFALGSVSAWAFGWDALVAIGTLGLAASTIVLALKTAALAGATATDVAAQDRPVLVPALQSDVAYDVDRFDAVIVNAGKGVALDIQASVSSAGQTTAADTWNKAALAPGADVKLHFAGVFFIRADPVVLHLQYRDIADNAHTSEIVVDFYKDPRTGNGHRRYADTLIDEIRQTSRLQRSPDVTSFSRQTEDHPAARPLVTDYVRNWRSERGHRWVLK